ncbi:MAG: leucine dehydrogenase [Simkaniaceae bacterium]|nr:leucine dehydrogenase [Simkaniaceae bacterium]
METLSHQILIEDLQVDGYERVVKCFDPETKLEAIIAIHNTKLGPALGGTRIYPYANFESALFDVLRLSKGMTYKSALAGLGLGGGKSVIIANSKTDKTPEMMRAFGRFVEALNGKYICAEDYGCTSEDVGIIQTETKHVVGVDGSRGSGNPSPYTAWGVFRGIQATVNTLFGDDSVEGKTVAIQGLGAVGKALAEHLFWHGAQLIVADIDPEVTEWAKLKLSAKVVPTDEILFVECDILAPCALGGIINSDTIPRLRCKAIAGGANNQLLNEQDGQSLFDRNILYAPDFVINAGGVINAEFDLHPEGHIPAVARNKVENIYNVIKSIYHIAEKNEMTTFNAAVSLAEDRIKKLPLS